MKWINKSTIIAFILGIIFSSISVSAYKLYAYQVGFEPDDEDWNVEAVDTALNDLYDMAYTGDATAEDIRNGKTALVQCNQVTGTLSSTGFSTVSGSVPCNINGNVFVEVGFRAKIIYYYCSQYARLGVYNYYHNESSLFWRNNQGGGNAWATVSASQYINGITDTGFNVYCYNGYNIIYAASS